jgi:MoaA/NifB/PqqE/SkfB family radical SAM enzyme/TusA-related sulfurtransferase
MARFLTGFMKEIATLKMLKLKEARELDPRFLLWMRKSSKYEKFVEIDGKIVMNSQMPPYGSEAFRRFLELMPRLKEGEKVPLSVNVSVTNRCNFSCWHCSNWGREEGQEDFPLDKLKETIRQMQDMGNCYIGLTGGEPTLRDDLEDIVEAIGERSHTILFTNGEKLNLERAKDLKSRGLFSASVSLDHFKPEIHDKLRGYKGAFDIAVKALKASEAAGLYTIAGVVPTREMINAGEVPTYYRFLRDLGVHEVRVLAPIPTGKLVGNREARWCGKDEEKQMWEYHMKLNKDKRYPKISEFSYLESEGLLGCMAGTYHFFIENDGTITPCDMIPMSFGNVIEEGFEPAYTRMAERFQVPRHQCYVRAAHALFKKGFDEEGKFPLSQEKSMEITGRVKNKRMPEFFKRLGMPPPVFDDEKPKQAAGRGGEVKKEKLDLRGLECPEPVWMTQEKIWDMEGGVLEVLVSEEEARDNVTKAARSEGWSVKTTSNGSGEYQLVLTSE